ncbi:MAG: hydrogenase maturation protease [Ignavibacteriales bacterium]|nr:hydrogenase maturation protease [Ignavibacteriales bacterium]
MSALTNPDRSPHRKPLTIIGLGNELLSDDGVGIRVVQELKKRLTDDFITYEEIAVGGLELLDFVVGCGERIIVDAITSGNQPAGTLYRFIQLPDQEPLKLASSHQIDLGQVLALAKLLGAALPDKLTVYGIEVSDTTTFRDACTAEVAKAIPTLVDLIFNDIQADGMDSPVHAGEWQVIDHLVSSPRDGCKDRMAIVGQFEP